MSIFALYEKETKKVVGFLTEEQKKDYRHLEVEVGFITITQEIEQQLLTDSMTNGGNIYVVDAEKAEFEIKEEKISYNPGPTQEERLNSLESALIALLMEV